MRIDIEPGRIELPGAKNFRILEICSANGAATGQTHRRAKHVAILIHMMEHVTGEPVPVGHLVLLYDVGTGMPCSLKTGHKRPIPAALDKSRCQVKIFVGIVIGHIRIPFFAGTTEHDIGGASLGDFVTVGGLSGTVETMTIRTIRLRDSRGTVHTVPFSSVDTVTNKTKDFAYHVAEVGVAYRENIDEVYDALRDIGAELQADAAYGSDILEPITIDGVDALADSAVVVRARLKTRPGSQWRIKRIFNDLVKRRFDERGIEIPYPHQTIYFGEDKKGGAPALQIKAADKQAIAEAFTQTKTPKAGAENKPLAVDRHHRDANDDGSDGGDGGGV